jgi:hypothetical protein
MAADGARTWILTCSPENCAAAAAHGHSVIGCKERRRNHALETGPGDRIVLYPTRVVRFAATVGIRNRAPEHRKLALRAQLRTVSDADAGLPMDRMHAAAGVAA